ncbi:excinuclease ABC subunit UvrC [Spongorhabdus nitratireducens]
MPVTLPEFDYRQFLKTAPTTPGVYKMMDGNGEPLYVGKAKNLKNRLSSYFRGSVGVKTEALVARICHIELLLAETEVEALLLEQNLIKQFRPPYNVLLRDDKSYPFIYLSRNDKDPAHKPRLDIHRGAKRHKGDYFGPYPSSGAVKETLNILQKIFKVRQCHDSYFNNRSRPCLQYQIKRCKAPCVDGLVSDKEYAADVMHSRLFLEGKSQELIYQLLADMESASSKLEFEQAAQLRDQIEQLREVQKTQSVWAGQGNCDVIAQVIEDGACCHLVMIVRDGRVLDSKHFIHDIRTDEKPAQYLLDFLAPFYIRNADKRDWPDEVLLPFRLDDTQVMADAIYQLTTRRVVFKNLTRGERRKWQEMAERNARNALNAHLANSQTVLNRYRSLEQLLNWPQPIQRMECFDISHSMGEKTVASCVVFNREGPASQHYRRYNIEGITPGDDYAAMAKALQKRYGRQQDSKDQAAGWPDLVWIDGGKGQLSAAVEAMSQLELDTMPVLIGIAKGPTRKAGLESLLLTTGEEIDASDHPGALHLIQHIRDEAHRFAITGHRQRRDKSRKRSALEDIPGVGAKRRTALIRFFGSARGVAEASMEEISRVEGISRKLAIQIYEGLHSDTQG